MREIRAHRRPLARHALRPNPTCMCLDEMFHNRQAKARPSRFPRASVICAVKALKDPVQVFSSDALPCIADTYRHAGVFLFSEDRHTAGDRMSKRIVHEVRKYLTQ